MTLKAPFPWFGGKSRAASLIWRRLGDVPNYVEPFAGSLAVLLSRPHDPRIETVNDKDAYLANFWRAVQAAPEDVAAWADAPVNEADLHARHAWLVSQGRLLDRVVADPHFFDTKIAGWWVWGLCLWIGDGWCDRTHRKLPYLGGVGRGLLSEALRADKVGVLVKLSRRLHNARVACGDWQRVLGPAVTTCNGITGVVLDPPYTDGSMTYTGGNGDIAGAVRAWALENGANPHLRIALCGYEGEHEMPGTWECVEWKAQGGYGSQGDGAGRDNAKRERIWFSPACLRPQRGLFDPLEPAQQAG